MASNIITVIRIVKFIFDYQMFKKVHVCIIYLVDGNDKLVHTKSRLVCDRVIFHIRLYVDVQ